MSSRRTRRFNLARPRRWADIASTDEILDVVRGVRREHPDASTVVVVDHPLSGRGLVLPIEGPDPGPEALDGLHAMVLEACEDMPGSRIVLVSIRPSEQDVMAERDLEQWRRLRSRHDGTGVVLVDWLLLHGAGRVFSLAGMTGPQP